MKRCASCGLEIDSRHGTRCVSLVKRSTITRMESKGEDFGFTGSLEGGSFTTKSIDIESQVWLVL